MGCIADLVFYATAACMFAQVNYELTEREKGGTLEGSLSDSLGFLRNSTELCGNQPVCRVHVAWLG